MFIAVLALGLFREACKLIVVIVLYLVGVVGYQAFRRGLAYFLRELP
jgi:uncharacterized membrane protein